MVNKVNFKSFLNLGIAIFILSISSFGQDSLQFNSDSIVVEEVDIEQGDLVIAALDSMANAPYYSSISYVYDTTHYSHIPDTVKELPVFQDSYYQGKLAALDSLSPFNLVYNKRVKAFINLYAVKRREQTAKMLGLQHQYFPMMEAVLDQYDMPFELKYLAIVESALNPKARSHAGAVGLWQFIYSTGKIYGLHQNSYMDERMDPVKSTHAACKYMKYLYKIYGKWDLVLAAYNCGPGNVNKAMRRSGSKTGNYWDLYPYLPRETRGYVPAFIAVNYVMNNHEAHLIKPNVPNITYFEYDTVHVKQPLKFEAIVEKTGIPIDELRYLNPTYKRDFVPAYSNKTSLLYLPHEEAGLFVSNEDTLYAEASKKSENDGTKLSKFKEDRIIYRVRSGDYLGKIANKYRVSVRSLRGWNGLRNNNIRVGQKLVIYPSSRYKPTQNVASNKGKGTVSKSGSYVYYQVQSGDTLWDIAKTRGVSIDQIKNWNSSLNHKRLKPGMKIIVGTNG